MDRNSINMIALITLYLIAYPLYFAAAIVGLIQDPQLRITSQTTRFAYVKEIGEIVLGWRTLVWFYFLTMTL